MRAKTAASASGHKSSALGRPSLVLKGKEPLLAPRGSRRKRILVVEDNDLNRKLFHDLLESRGYDIIETAEGMEAIGLAKRHRPDLIIMDIQLAEVSGIEVTKWLKESEELRPIPVIAVTAFAMKGDQERIMTAGFEAYISKPITVNTFLSTVSRLLGEQSMVTASE